MIDTRKAAPRARPFRCGGRRVPRTARGSKNASRLSHLRKKCEETGHVVTFFLICLQRRRDSAFRSQHSFIWRTIGLRACITATEPDLSRHGGRTVACGRHAATLSTQSTAGDER
ncbi:hypothetical protein A8F72_30990 [Burkholderia cenocepacia]|nr:hypothetical protein A8F32_12050 [Burkholderia cenocepacia]ONI96887.1 hypothetical protein A8F33_32170 [Burkholderia cenocepacia]ONJ01414.1 hypothetical protein A8F53_15405 [Burkholderia cenocepacia]ONJ33737.1 hypothetical protein A8F38_06335 [Burkholderia cenocepacia]ONY68196.1 hypothetical protein A8F35_24570 [Burkholderia cenocepacia]